MEKESKKLEFKRDNSPSYYKNAMIHSCSHVVMRNGNALAISFPYEKTGWKNPNSTFNIKRSSEVESLAR